MYRTVDIPGDQIDVHADIGKGRILRATLLIEEVAPAAGKSTLDTDDPFGRELDELLAMTEPVSEFVDDSRESFYTPDHELRP
jgi:hypothetical protein